MPYTINASAVQVGDIVLTRSNGLVGRVIRAGAGGDFTHALTCCDPTVLMEAIGEGARKISLRTTYVSDSSKVSFLRAKNELGNKTKERFQEVANRLFGTRYSKIGAATSVLSFFSNPDDLGIFCSQLVARCHIEAGTGVFADSDPQKVTPYTIQTCSNLIDVSDQILAKASFEEIEALEAIDGGLRTNPVRHYQQCLGKAYDTAMLSSAVRQVINHESTHRPENLSGLIANIAQSRILTSTASVVDTLVKADDVILQSMRQHRLLEIANQAVGFEVDTNLKALNNLLSNPAEARRARQNIMADLKISREMYKVRVESAETWCEMLETKLASVKELLAIDCCVTLGYARRIHIHEQAIAI